MKIGLISRGRTQSSAIVQTLSNKHNLTNKFEEYFILRNNFLKYQGIKILSNKNYVALDEFQGHLKNITNTMFLTENFICKLWPSMLALPPHKFNNNESFADIKKKIVFNINECFRIKDYDQLYYINKELHRSTLSWVYAKKTNLFHRSKFKKYSTPMITVGDDDLDRIRFYILEYCLQEKIKDFLCEQKIPYIDITDSYSQYIDIDVIQTTTTNNDYTKLITNYDILPSFIDNWYNVCCENTIDWKYY
jgi:hypothetical protein